MNPEQLWETTMDLMRDYADKNPIDETKKAAAEKDLEVLLDETRRKR